MDPSANPRNHRHAKHCICCLSDTVRSSPALLMPFVAKRIFDHEPVEIDGSWGLRDIKQGMAYSLCRTLECTHCGVLFLDYRFSDVELAALYKGYRGTEYNTLRTKYEPNYAATATHYTGRANYLDDVERILAAHLPDRPRVLDWGGDSGVNAPFRYCADSLHVYDISGVDVCEGATRVSLETCCNHQYDLITCSQVLEHVSYPADVLGQMLKAMNAETVLYIEVPFEEIFRIQDPSVPRGEMKRHWHEHINFFSPSSLECLARACGLEVIEARTHPVSLGWKDSAIQMLICKLAYEGS